jgi:hypothetical protein
MEPLNHDMNHDMNDMDELFRKAAKGYPLKVDDEDWESISGKLLTRPEAISPAKKNKRNKYFGPILLFFLISGGSVFYLKFRDVNGDKIRMKNTRNILNKETSSSASEGQKPILKARINEQSNHIRVFQSIEEKSELRLLEKETTFSQKFRENNLDMGFIKSPDQIFTQRLVSLYRPMLPGSPISVFDGAVAVPFLQTGDSMKSLTDSQDNNKSVFVSQSYKGLSFVLTGGPDFSNVKSQAVNKAGYNLGLLAGYGLNRKLSIESGILWSRKKYYSDGKYFNMNKVGPSMPSNMKIMTVDGQLTLLEIPLKLKYDFAHTKKTNLFITTGIAANICLKERNNYLTEMNGLQEYHSGLYKNVSYCPISLISFSAGFECGLDKSRTIRVEPYIKIPLKEVGMGSVPVLSTGINTGISNLFGKGRP